MTEPRDSSPAAAQRGIGIIAWIGLAWITLSGGCTETFVLPFLLGAPDYYGVVYTALTIGLPSIALGLVVFVIAYAARRTRPMGTLARIGVAWIALSIPWTAITYYYGYGRADSWWEGFAGHVSLGVGIVILLIGCGIQRIGALMWFGLAVLATPIGWIMTTVLLSSGLAQLVLGAIVLTALAGGCVVVLTRIRRRVRERDGGIEE